MRTTSLARVSTLILMAAGTAHAATFTVTSIADSGPGSLRAAMESAYATTGAPHTIDFSLPAGSVIELDSTLPLAVGQTLSIGGSSGNRPTIDGRGLHRLFVAGSNSALTLHDLVLRNGFTNVGGGCLASEYGNSPITLDNVRMEACKAINAANPLCGGAVLSYSPVFVRNAQFVGNVAESGSGFAMGGAICARQLLWVESSRFEGNLSIGQGSATAVGGAITGGTPLTVLRSQFLGNEALQADPAIGTSGGAIYARNDAKVTLRQSLFFDNGARDGSALYASVASVGATMQLVASNNTFVGNHDGAAMMLWNMQLDLRNNSFWRNLGRAGVGAHLLLRGSATAVDAFANNLLAASEDGGPLCSSDSLPAILGTGYNLFADTSCGFIDHYSLIDTGDLRIRGLRTLDASAASMPVLDVFAGSPVIDAGNPDVPGADTAFACAAGDALDADRPADGDGDGIAQCDIGALELQREAPIFADNFEQLLLR